MAHQCPWCVLRYTWAGELDYHMREDHDEADRMISVVPRPRLPAAGDSPVLTAARETSRTPELP
jgi:hypothetical protein